MELWVFDVFEFPGSYFGPKLAKHQILRACKSWQNYYTIQTDYTSLRALKKMSKNVLYVMWYCPVVKNSNNTGLLFNVLHPKKHINGPKVMFFSTHKNCNITYVGETALPLYEKINIHLKVKSSCGHMIKHFRY